MVKGNVWMGGWYVCYGDEVCGVGRGSRHNSFPTKNERPSQP